jgi:hypothetical protein
MARMRAFTGTGLAEDQHLLSRLHHRARVADQHAAGAIGYGEVLERYAPVAEFQALDATGLVEARVELLRRLDERHHAARRGVPHGDELIAINEPGEGDLDLEKGRRELRHRAKRQLAGEVFWGRQQQRHHGDQRPGGVGDPGQAPVQPHHREPASDELAVGGA